MRDYRIGALWIGGDLSYLEQLCLKSFCDAGHEVVLYHYHPLNRVPAGITLADAASILPQHDFLRHARTSSPALHSDLFRYRLLAREPGMIWADTDAYCLRPFTTTTGHFYGWESPRHVNGGVLGLPPDSETLARLLDFTSDPYAIPPWFAPEERARLQDLADRGQPVAAGDMVWGVWGPHALTHFLQATGEIRHALPRAALYPFSFKDRRLMLRRGYDTSAHITDETFSIHFYGRRMRRRLAEAEGGFPKRFSLIGKLLHRHGIDPQAAPLPAPALLPADAPEAGESDDSPADPAGAEA